MNKYLNKIVTPSGLISSVLVVGALAGAVIGVEARYFHSDQAEKMKTELVEDQQAINNNMLKTQQQDRVETDLGLVKLEIAYLESQLETKAARPSADISISDTNKRLKYLEDKRKSLEAYQLHLVPTTPTP
jgi:hypothetical protein